MSAIASPARGSSGWLTRGRAAAGPRRPNRCVDPTAHGSLSCAVEGGAGPRARRAARPEARPALPGVLPQVCSAGVAGCGGRRPCPPRDVVVVVVACATSCRLLDEPATGVPAPPGPTSSIGRAVGRDGHAPAVMGVGHRAVPEFGLGPGGFTAFPVCFPAGRCWSWAAAVVVFSGRWLRRRSARRARRSPGSESRRGRRRADVAALSHRALHRAPGGDAGHSRGSVCGHKSGRNRPRRCPRRSRSQVAYLGANQPTAPPVTDRITVRPR